jgi:hypothetical protein
VTAARRTALAALAAALLPAGGCRAPIAWLVAQFAPPKKVKALYALPKGRRVLVFVDDFSNPVSYEPIKRQLTLRLNERLVAAEVVTETVDYDRLFDLMAQRRDFNTLGVVEVGSELGAEVVFYVHIDRFHLRDNEFTPLWEGEFKVSVKVVDVAEVRTLWPEDRELHPVPAVKLQPVQETSGSYGEAVAEKLADRMADRIVDLFRDHYVDVKEQPADEAAPEPSWEL